MGNPLRVLHVAVNMNRGGAETLLMNLYRNIDRNKLQFDFLTCKKGVFDEEIQNLGGQVYRIPYLTDVGHWGYLKELDHFYASHSGYKIVHSHLDKMSGIVLRAAKKAGIPIRIAHSHNTSSEGGFAEKAYKSYAGKFILSSATHLFACSKDAANWLFSEQTNSAVILKNGIESDKFSFNLEIRRKVRAELNLSDDQLSIGHVGRFDPQKNHMYLIDIFEQIAKLKPNSTLLLVGEGPLRSEIQKKVQRLNLHGKVRFLGIRSDINQLMQAFDVMLFPSLHEGVPVTLIEAQGAGLPSLVSNVISEEVDLGVGLIEYESLSTQPDEWARKLLNRNLARQDVNISIKKQGYDIQYSTESLQNFYLYGDLSMNKGAI